MLKCRLSITQFYCSHCSLEPPKILKKFVKDLKEGDFWIFNRSAMILSCAAVYNIYYRITTKKVKNKIQY